MSRRKKNSQRFRSSADEQILEFLEVHSVRAGREIRFELDPKPLDEMKIYLQRVSAEWNQPLPG